MPTSARPWTKWPSSSPAWSSSWGSTSRSHHLNREDGKSFEEGAQISLKNIRGSGGVANFSMSVIGYERNQQAQRPDLTRVRVLKCRHTGTTGVADIIKWDELGLQRTDH